MSRMRDKVDVNVVRDFRDQIIGRVARRVGPCGHIHEGHGAKNYQARNELARVIENCPGCIAVSAAQSQPAAS